MLVRTPGFFKSQMTTDVFVRHYTAVADASPVPVLLYNFTAVTGVNLLPAAVARLADAPEHRRHEGIERRHRADRRSGGVHAATTSACSPARRRRSIAALCVGAAGGILALAVRAARRRASGCSS